MNYKKLIPNQNFRINILNLLDFLPDEVMIPLQYKISTGRKLNLNNPTRYTEKLQWYKLNYRKPLMTQCADKYDVRKYIESKKLQNILVPLYGVYDSSEEITFDSLPEKFVLKTTNGSHTNIIVNNKANINIKKTKKELDKWLNSRSVKLGREWPYYDIKPRIISEKLLETSNNNGLVDYKFFCFNGEPEYLFVMTERDSSIGLNIGIFDIEFNHLPVKRKNVNNLSQDFPKPKNYNQMVEIARILSKDFPHVRVDLYNIEGEIYFGELTFFHGSGYVEFEPDQFDYILGEKFKLPLKYL